MNGPRIGLIGARRQHQGLGPFVARDLVLAGAEVSCFLATRAATLEATQRELAGRGSKARGYLDLEKMLAREHLDALAICSPAASHESYLWAACEAGLHVLCEKPLVWDGPDLGRRAARITDAFADRGLILWENCQWPYVLRGFEALHPGSLAAPAQRFAMHLAPASRGAQALGDAMPHVLSLLQTLAPGAAAALEDVSFSSPEPQRGALQVRFVYRTPAHGVQTRIELVQAHAEPRRACLQVDEHIAHRRVAAESYRLCLAAEGRSVPLADPLTLLVADFVRELSAPGSRPATSRGREITERMALLGDLIAAYQRHSPVAEAQR